MKKFLFSLLILCMVPSIVLAKDYKNFQLNIFISYPDDWTLNEKISNNKFSVRSPDTTAMIIAGSFYTNVKSEMDFNKMKTEDLKSFFDNSLANHKKRFPNSELLISKITTINNRKAIIFASRYYNTHFNNIVQYYDTTFLINNTIYNFSMMTTDETANTSVPIYFNLLNSFNLIY